MTNLVHLVFAVCICVEIDRFVKFLLKLLENMPEGTKK